jgi:uncharacterized protein YggE
VEKAPTAENALTELNTKMAKIIDAEKALGIPEADIETQNYSLSTTPDAPMIPVYLNTSKANATAGAPASAVTNTATTFTANQQLSIKVRNITGNSKLLGDVIAEANKAGANQVSGVRLDVANLDELKQQARELAIKDAKAKSASMAKAAGVHLGKITGWYENILQSPDTQDYSGNFGMGGAEGGGLTKSSPQIPTGTQEIVIELNLNYEVN